MPAVACTRLQVSDFQPSQPSLPLLQGRWFDSRFWGKCTHLFIGWPTKFIVQIAYPLKLPPRCTVECTSHEGIDWQPPFILYNQSLFLFNLFQQYYDRTAQVFVPRYTDSRPFLDCCSRRILDFRWSNAKRVSIQWLLLIKNFALYAKCDNEITVKASNWIELGERVEHVRLFI